MMTVTPRRLQREDGLPLIRGTDEPRLLEHGSPAILGWRRPDLQLLGHS